MSRYPSTTESSQDSDLLSRVRIALSLRLRASVRRIQIEAQDGLVTLRGKVSSFFDRQLAYEASRRVPGVRRVQDELIVEEESEMKKEPTDPLSTWQPALVRAALATSPLLLLVASLIGCGGPKVDRLPVHPVKGQVTLQGKPLANALVVLHPKDAKSPGPFSARGQTDGSGNFQVTTYDTNDGAPAGEYAVTVQAYQLIQKGESYEPGPNILSPKLSKPETTDISVRVAEGPNNLTPIEVTR